MQAYNDWMIDEWCAGEGKGRLIPLTHGAALGRRARGRRGPPLRASKGSFAVTFPENPFPLGLPSIHDKDQHWEPVFQACQDTETVDLHAHRLELEDADARRPTRRSS